MIRFICFFLIITTLTSCLPGCDNGNSESLADTAGVDADSIEQDIIVQDPLPKPPKDETITKYENEGYAKSPFKKYPCCLDEAKRKEKACCCLKVLNEYKAMYLADNPNLGELGSKDPILSYCTKLMKKEYNNMMDELEGDEPLF